MDLRFKQKRQLPMIFQSERTECGHACLAMVGNYWGHQLDLFAMRARSTTSTRGMTLLDLTQLAEGLGFVTRPLQVPIEELTFIKCPAILHWNMNHFVVLKRVKKSGVIIHDPAMGIRHCSLEEVSQAFTGIVLEMEKSNSFKSIYEQKKLTLMELVKTIHGANSFWVMLILISLSIEILTLMNPLLMQYVTDNVIGFSEPRNLWVLAFGFVIMVFIQVIAEYARGNMVIYFTNHLTEQFSSNLVKHLLKLPLDFFEKRHKGDLQSKFQSIDHIQKKISTDFVSTVLDGLMIMMNVTVMVIYSPVLTILVIGMLLLGLGIRYLSYHPLRKYTEASVCQHAKSMSIFLETLQGIIPIKSFLKERSRFNTWRNCYVESLNADIVVAKLNVFYQVTNQWLFQVELILVICVGAWLVLRNTLTMGMLFAFMSYRLILVSKTSSLIEKLFDYRLISIQLNRLSDILFQAPECLDEGVTMVRPIQGSLSLENVSFKYDQNGPFLLHGVSFHIKSGEKVAITGPSGCGKSTLLKIMMGLLNPTEGEIYIDNIPLRTIGLKNFRALTASVMQEDSLFSGSILDNIAFFDEQLDMDRIHQSAKLAFIHEDICRFPMGYETMVGDMGSLLSGGQKQRILLARALYKQPKLLFLDEATSHLDVENEKNINQALKSLDITQMIIAHRPETIRMADRVIDLGNPIHVSAEHGTDLCKNKRHSDL